MAPATRILIGLFFSLWASQILAKTYSLNEGRSRSNSFRIVNPTTERLYFEYYIGSFDALKSQKSSDLGGSRGEFHDLKFISFKMTNEEGKVSLPYQSFIVKAKKENLIVGLKHLPGKFFKDIYSQVAPKKPCRCDKNSPISYEIKGDYENESSPLYEIESLGTYRGQALTRVKVYGARQRSAGIEVFPSLKLSLMTKDRSPLALVNFKKDFKESNRHFLIIASKELEEGALEWSLFKQSQGYQVDLFYYEDIATDALTLQKFIREQYKLKGHQYAVIIGHEFLVPTFYRETSMAWDTPTDYPYFYMDNDEARADLFPEIFYGRVTGATNEDIVNQVKKLKEFENRSWRNAEGISRSIGIASNEGINPTDEEYVAQMLDPLKNGHNLTPKYFFQKDPQAQVSQINTALNRGAYWLNYIGHGSGVSWPSIHQGEYLSSDIYQIKPGAVKPVIIDVACQNGRFNEEGRLGETFMNAQASGEPVGALSYFGGSVDISWDPPAIMAVGIGESMGKNRNSYSLFGHILQGQNHLLQNYSTIESIVENHVWYHLLGDPSLKMR